MPRSLKICLALGALLTVAACGTDYSPNTYASGAAQQAGKVEAGIIVGYRQVLISANGTVGAVTGGAAGGVLGAQVGGGNMDQALGGVVGSAVGGLIGTMVEHVTGDTEGWEYIIKKYNGDMISVTQTEDKPLTLGEKVLVISNSQQARVVPDYSVDIPLPKKAEDDKSKNDDKTKASAGTAVPDKKAAGDKPSGGDAAPDEQHGSAGRTEQPVSALPPDKPTVTDLPPPDNAAPPSGEPEAAAPPAEMPSAGSWSPSATPQ